MALALDFPPGSLPELPPIHDTALRQRVFTHRSFAARPTHIFEDSPSDPSPDNEVLEHLGDQVLGLVVTELLQEMYPNLRVGPSTKMRALVVGNHTLATVAMRYRLPDYLRLHRAQSITLKASMNVQADVFESYVGGLYRDQGLRAVQIWLRALFRPYVVEAYRIVRKQHGLAPADFPTSNGNGNSNSNSVAHTAAPTAPAPRASPPSPPPTPPGAVPPIGHLGLFNQRLQQAGHGIEWRFADSIGEGSKATPVWIARAMVDGTEWGLGRGNTKKGAKNEAAKQGLRYLGIHVDDAMEQPDQEN